MARQSAVPERQVKCAPGAKVVLDSVSPEGVRITTVETTIHRFVLAELNTHRAFSRNSASSRAIPAENQLARVVADPAWPISWPGEQPGMQGGPELEGESLEDATDLFAEAHRAVSGLVADYLQAHPDKAGRLHKSVVNRLVEPFMWHKAIITSTEWDNFFGLRCSPLAQPELRAAAEAIREAMATSVPVALGYGAWHVPYTGPEDAEAIRRGGMGEDTLLRVSAARCARVSYLTHDGKRDIGRDLELFERLVREEPPHSSPLEHVATPARPGEHPLGNFAGWHQLRHRSGR